MGTVEVVFVIFGLSLICVAIFGSGIEIKEFKIPRAGRFARIFAGCVGCALIILGLLIEGTLIRILFKPNNGPEDPNTLIPIVSTPNNGSEDPNTTIILNVRLGRSEDGKEKEIETKLIIAINGGPVEEFLLNSESPSASRSVKLDKSGDCEYHIGGYSKWSTTPDNVTVIGNGNIFMRAGRTYTVGASSIPSSSTQEWNVYLIEDKKK